MSSAPDKFEDLKPFSHLEVSIDDKQRFEDCVKKFKSLVQKSQIITLYKQKQVYEKPSDKKRRKKREYIERKRIAEHRERLINSGEWDKIQKRKMKRKAEKLQRKREAQDG